MTSHSKEPWVAGPNILQLVCSEPDQVIVVEPFGMSDSKYLLPHDVRVANARRIVACVNICAGIGTEELEQQHDLVSAQLASEQADPESPSPTLQTIPDKGLVWVCLNVEGMSIEKARTAMLWLSGALTKAKKDGKTSAQFILTASLWPGQMQVQDLPDEELASVGLVRSSVMQSERQELAANLETLIAEKVVQRDELLMALEALVAKAECFGMGNSTDEYVAAQAVIAKARGVA